MTTSTTPQDDLARLDDLERPYNLHKTTYIESLDDFPQTKFSGRFLLFNKTA